MSDWSQIILEEYEKKAADYRLLEDIVFRKIQEALEQNHIMYMALEHRVKQRSSLSAKLNKKDGKYHKLSDVTDVLGLRVICYFADDVDAIMHFIEDLFRIDRANSVDKRIAMNPSAFGYLSVHYICQLPDTGEYPEELKDLKFEIQIRSTLQHVWAEIEHDLGYKSEFSIPQKIRRDFSRVAGLLEIADEKFINIRNRLNNYSKEVHKRILLDDLEGIQIDQISLTEYLKYSRRMRKFLDELAGMTGTEIKEISPEIYLKQLNWFGIGTLQELREMYDRNANRAFDLAIEELLESELDIISSNVVLRYLCQAELIERNYTEEQVTEFLMLSMTKRSRAERLAKRICGK